MSVISRVTGHAVAAARKVLPHAPSAEPDLSLPGVSGPRAAPANAAALTGNKSATGEVAARTVASPAAKRPASRTTATKKPASKKPATKKPATKKPERASPVSKKTSAPAIDVAQLRVKEGEEAWAQGELDEILEELHAQRAHSLAILEAQEAELSGLMRDPGDGAGQDQADVGSTSFERDQELTVVNSEREKLDQIERALQSLHEGTYGICESCGEPIGKARLLVFPRATLCMTCKQREERR